MSADKFGRLVEGVRLPVCLNTEQIHFLVLASVLLCCQCFPLSEKLIFLMPQMLYIQPMLHVYTRNFLDFTSTMNKQYTYC